MSGLETQMRSLGQRARAAAKAARDAGPEQRTRALSAMAAAAARERRNHPCG